jgi:hypothetical protein
MNNPLPIGAQLMNLRPEARRCPECLGAIKLVKACGGKKMPECAACRMPYPRWFPKWREIPEDKSRLKLDDNGIVAGYK